MRKSKHGEALFDKLSREGGEISDVLRPGGGRWTRDKPDQGGYSSYSEAGLRLVGSRDRYEDGETWVCVEGRCLRFRLTARSGAIALFVGLVLFSSAFVVGRSSGRKAALRAAYERGQAVATDRVPGEVELALAQAPATGLVQDLLPNAPAHREEAEVSAPSESQPRWVRGHTYVVAQEFLKGREADAQAAQNFLAKQGISTAVVRFPSGSLQLITTRGFDRRISGQKSSAGKLLARVHAAGKKYYAAGGRYRLQGYFRKLTAQNW